MGNYEMLHSCYVMIQKYFKFLNAFHSYHKRIVIFRFFFASLSIDSKQIINFSSKRYHVFTKKFVFYERQVLDYIYYAVIIGLYVYLISKYLK